MSLFKTEILDCILHSISNFAERNVFCIDEEFYTYKQFSEAISKIRIALKSSDYTNRNVGLVINDDLNTYASIVALWLEGCAYVPLHPHWPLERCEDIISQVALDIIIDSSEDTRFINNSVINSSALTFSVYCLNIERDFSDDDLAYILFTSGSTGKPKGVQLSRGNLASFVDAFWNYGYIIDEEDRCLQCFDLSFDLSIMSYLVPLLKGACIYTVPHDVIKYSYIAELIEEQLLTVALMAPSTIKYLRQYFEEIDCSSLKYSLFCGEALPLEVTSEWSKCASNAEIYNVYGPTENTIFCSIYKYLRSHENKAYNGILSIGKPMLNCGMKLFNEDCSLSKQGDLGELCLSGNLLTPGYLNNPEKNNEAFFVVDGIRWYHTGDLCFQDDEGDIMYSGRLDHQAKIQGFRVELGEIEHHARTFLSDKNVVCIAFDNLHGLTEIAMFVESVEFDTNELLTYMRSKMPSYMIPTKILFEPIFQLNANDKIDKNILKAKL